MRKCRWLISLCVALCLGITLVPVSAVEIRASKQINYHAINVSASGGSIKTEFTIIGTGVMDEIGCQSITIYEKSGSGWNFVTSFNEDDPGMSKSEAARHSNLISWACETGVQYCVDVTVFAENSAGRDTRSKTVYVTG